MLLRYWPLNFGEFLDGHAEGVCAVDELVVDVGEVRDVADLERLLAGTLPLEVAAQRVEDDDGDRVPDVGLGVGGDPTDIQPHFVADRAELFLLVGEGVVQLHAKSVQGTAAAPRAGNRVRG
jgi:hypothetical protein